MSLRERVAQDINRRGVQPVARDLRVSRATLANYVLGAAREGSVLVIETRAEKFYSAEE